MTCVLGLWRPPSFFFLFACPACPKNPMTPPHNDAVFGVPFCEPTPPVACFSSLGSIFFSSHFCLRFASRISSDASKFLPPFFLPSLTSRPFFDFVPYFVRTLPRVASSPWLAVCTTPSLHWPFRQSVLSQRTYRSDRTVSSFPEGFPSNRCFSFTSRLCILSVPEVHSVPAPLTIFLLTDTRTFRLMRFPPTRWFPAFMRTPTIFMMALQYLSLFFP